MPRFIPARKQIGTKIITPKKRNTNGKYSNVITKRHDGTFQSNGEMARYDELKLEQRAGLIRNLQLKKPAYPIHLLGGEKLFTYNPDYTYERKQKDGAWKYVVEDYKSGLLTETYEIKKKAMRLQHGIEIFESGKPVRPKKRKQNKPLTRGQ